jgi:uncharacterized iron-regulated membrane protein
MRNLWNVMVWLHRWIALTLGAFVVVVSVSGSFIAFEGQLVRARNARLPRAEIPASGPVRLPLDTILARARALGPIGNLTLPDAEGRAVVATMPDEHEVFLSPYTGAVLGTRTRAQRHAGFVGGFMRANHAVHTSLMVPKIGNKVVVWSTIASVVLVLGGLYLWWRDKIWRLRTASSWKRINFDLHHLLGIATFVVLLLMTVTGVIMHFPLASRAIRALDRERPTAATRQPPPAADMAPVSLDRAASAGLAALPGSTLRTINIPPDTQWPLLLGLRLSEDRTPLGSSRVAVDRWTGAVLSVRSSRTAGLGTRINNLQRPLHTGTVLGLPTQIIWFLGCWVLVSQAVTGFLMWWHGRPARKAEAARKKMARAAPAAPASA